MEALFKDREMVAKNCTDTSHTVKTFFNKTREVLNQREKALLSTIQKYSDVKLTKFDLHYQKLVENRKAILRLVDSIEKLLQQSQVEDVGILTEKQAIAEELDMHQQSVLSIQDMLVESKSAHAFLSYKEDYRFLQPLSEIGTLNECRREPDSIFLSMRRVVVTETRTLTSMSHSGSRTWGQQSLSRSLESMKHSRKSSPSLPTAAVAISMTPRGLCPPAEEGGAERTYGVCPQSSLAETSSSNS